MKILKELSVIYPYFSQYQNIFFHLYQDSSYYKRGNPHSLSWLPSRDNNNDDENKSVKSNFTYSSLHNQLINLSSIPSLMSLINQKTLLHDHDQLLE